MHQYAQMYFSSTSDWFFKAVIITTHITVIVIGRFLNYFFRNFLFVKLGSSYISGLSSYFMYLLIHICCRLDCTEMVTTLKMTIDKLHCSDQIAIQQSLSCSFRMHKGPCFSWRALEVALDEVWYECLPTWLPLATLAVHLALTVLATVCRDDRQKSHRLICDWNKHCKLWPVGLCLLSACVCVLVCVCVHLCGCLLLCVCAWLHVWYNQSQPHNFPEKTTTPQPQNLEAPFVIVDLEFIYQTSMT